WNAAPSIYVNAHHKKVHYRNIAYGIASHVAPGDTVLDYGCGEALSADVVAARCCRLYLYDAASNVRNALESRFSATPSIKTIDQAALAALPDGTIDVIIANSILQYLDAGHLSNTIDGWKRLLAPEGHIIIADVIPPTVGPATDAVALLHFARLNGFLAAAGIGLIRTFFSDYRHVRGRLGLTRFSQAEFEALMRSKGLEAMRISPNLGHNQSRMAFMVTHPRPQPCRTPPDPTSLGQTAPPPP
ncbi:MAG: class I SAM-dependent methyltransferase, partial [Hyphomicrobiaceae bacterium]